MTTSRLRFTKMHGVGNDLIVVDARAVRPREWAGLATEMCDRRTGVGADGLLVIDRSALADLAMRMYNPDGTPDFCGNGLRCVARYAAEHDPDGARIVAATSTTYHIATLAGTRRAEVAWDASGGCDVTVEMGEPKFAPEDIPMRVHGTHVVDRALRLGTETVNVTSLSTGSAHTVVFVQDLPDDERFLDVSPRIERHPAYPERTSVLWTQVLDRSHICLRIWERGAGETWGCGTGACAAAVAAATHGYVDEQVVVSSRGGDLRIRWTPGEPMLMSGPAEYVYVAEYPL